MKRSFVGITGASGHAYATQLIRSFVAAGTGVDLSLTPSGSKVLRHELGIQLPARDPSSALDDSSPDRRELIRWLGSATAEEVRLYPADAVEAPPSSGTALTGAVVICPCSMGTLARVAAGFSSNLVERAADVALKEKRPLVVVPRETPLSALHLENLLKLARLGAVVLPAAPGFYHHPGSVEDLVDHVVGKILDALGVAHGLGRRWSGKLEPLPEAGIEPPSLAVGLPGEIGEPI